MAPVAPPPETPVPPKGVPPPVARRPREEGDALASAGGRAAPWPDSEKAGLAGHPPSCGGRPCREGLGTSAVPVPHDVGPLPLDLKGRRMLPYSGAHVSPGRQPSMISVSLTPTRFAWCIARVGGSSPSLLRYLHVSPLQKMRLESGHHPSLVPP